MHDELQLAHFNKPELEALDKFQGKSERINGIKVYSKLKHIMETPGLEDQIHKDHHEQMLNGGREFHEKLHGLAKNGRFGDTELAYISKPLMHRLDKSIGGPSINPRDGKHEYFLGTMLGSMSKYLTPALAKMSNATSNAYRQYVAEPMTNAGAALTKYYNGPNKYNLTVPQLYRQEKNWGFLENLNLPRGPYNPRINEARGRLPSYPAFQSPADMSLQRALAADRRIFEASNFLAQNRNVQPLPINTPNHNMQRPLPRSALRMPPETMQPTLRQHILPADVGGTGQANLNFNPLQMGGTGEVINSIATPNLVRNRVRFNAPEPTPPPVIERPFNPDGPLQPLYDLNAPIRGDVGGIGDFDPTVGDVGGTNTYG
jgi:hypothetical protein